MNNKVKDLLSRSECLVASFVLSRDETLAGVAESAGLHALILDFEHGMHDKNTAAAFINAARGGSVAVFVRCPFGDLHRIGALFDHGLDGVIVTDCRSVEDVRKVIDAVKFAPAGRRGLNPFVQAAGFGGMDATAYTERSNERTSVWIMAENKATLENIEQICLLPGLDGLFFGPYDLSLDCGIPGQTGHPDIMALIDRGFRECERHGVHTGIFARTVADMEPWLRKGVRMAAVGVDLSTLADCWRGVARGIAELTGDRSRANRSEGRR